MLAHSSLVRLLYCMPAVHLPSNPARVPSVRAHSRSAPDRPAGAAYRLVRCLRECARPRLSPDVDWRR
eukprot:5901264-Alexandrium_andersonii.AAC.1